jgi:hypothetical protein
VRDDRSVPGGALLIHWSTEGGRADCGAPESARIASYQFLVTCPESLIAVRIDTLERRLRAHRAALALARARDPWRER